MKNYLFVTALIATVQELQGSGNSFSVHDITDALRSAVNNGDIQFSDRQTEDVDGINTYRVKHEEVKAIFNDLYGAGAFKSLSKIWAGGFWSYSDSSPVCCSSSSALATQVQTTPTVKPQTVLTVLEEKVVSYLNNRDKGTEVSIKKIQSRLKGYPITCQELTGIIGRFGYTLIPSFQGHSMWRVKV